MLLPVNIVNISSSSLILISAFTTVHVMLVPRAAALAEHLGSRGAAPPHYLPFMSFHASPYFLYGPAAEINRPIHLLTPTKIPVYADIKVFGNIDVV